MTTAQSTVGGMAAPRKTTKNMDDPRGQFGAFLRHKIDAGSMGQSEWAKLFGITDRGLRKWLSGQGGPTFENLNNVAKVLGFANWAKLAAAVVKHHESEKR